MNGDESRKMAGLTILSGPSGSGKGTVINVTLGALRTRKEPVWLGISDTTRAPRKLEVDGRDYNFVTQDQFDERVANGYYLEYSHHMSASYGTPAPPLIEQLESGTPVLLEVDVDGARMAQKIAREKFGINPLLVFLQATSLEQLEAQLRGRGTESEDKIVERLERAQLELDVATEFDVILINRYSGFCADILWALISR